MNRILDRKLILDDFLPSHKRENDPGVEEFARRVLLTQRASLERQAKFIHFNLWGLFVGPRDSIRPSRARAIAREEESRLLEIARERSRLRFIVATCCGYPNCAHKIGPDGSPYWRWDVRPNNLIDSLGILLLCALTSWGSQESAQVENFIKAFFARLQSTARRQTAAGIVALVVAFLKFLASGPSFVDRLVEMLTRRVLAPGGKTACFAPLN